ncbi:SAP domain-containing protein [Priestia aryabhattai]|uniref:SAP domain-containing protein n=1 Tax=Priestia aryabhattai TaxID=412384 RepID=UPI001F0B02E9|nr:SAP domain-containing protein [Priestia aryabhattai]
MQSFNDFYWLREELQSFCRKNGISASVSKIGISDRIEVFLQTREIKKLLENQGKKEMRITS